MALRDIPDLYKSISLDFHIVLWVGQEYPFYIGTVKLPAVVNHRIIES